MKRRERVNGICAWCRQPFSYLRRKVRTTPKECCSRTCESARWRMLTDDGRQLLTQNEPPKTVWHLCARLDDEQAACTMTGGGSHGS